MQRLDFAGPRDLRHMQELASRLWSPTSRFHPGQLAWSRYFRPVDPDRLGDAEAIARWEQDGQTVGFGWAESPDWLELQVDPAHPEAAVEVVEWFEEWSDAEEQTAMVVEGDAAVEAALEAAGFAPQPSSPFFTHHVLDLRDLTPLPETPGYAFRSVGADEWGPRAAVHAAAWSDDAPSAVDPSSYRQVMQAWPYQPELDWVAVDGSGQMVASALVWLDPGTGVGLVEPVGCVPAHRGRGLAGAVTLAALHALREKGGTLAQVTPRGDDDYPVPRRIYSRMGFEPTARVVMWSRSLA
ncbi:GNAT family N-acetyltransferase [Terrabacter sp. NPDC080008]|uniref:GNAT family N-acetyltransferase n=1 Tax=Terrabacter sp. NPDC080008 TaxID=3155176 RepID=UPI00344C588E